MTCRFVSVHAYSPPLWRMGTYVVEADGTLRRESISYAEELRPVDAVAWVRPHPRVRPFLVARAVQLVYLSPVFGSGGSM